MRIATFLDSAPLFALYMAHEEIIGDLQSRLAREGVHFLQALILTGLFFEEGRAVRPGELARILNSSPSKISHAVRALEKKGWIKRANVPSDARAYLLTLTSEGQRRVPRLIKILDHLQNQVEEAPGGGRFNGVLRSFVDVYRNCKFP